MKLSVKPDTCSGHARCQKLCPEVFGGDDFGYVVLTMQDIRHELQDKVREAVIACPEGALKIDA